jgi:hypothetical protein
MVSFRLRFIPNEDQGKREIIMHTEGKKKQ